MTETHFRQAFLLLLVTAISAAFVAMIRAFLLTILLAAIFAGLSYPVYEWILGRVQGRRALAAIATLLVLLVLVMAPLAASFATQLGFRPDAFLMAVAIGAACDFLTPIGHQCNTLVMGPGGYRFGDYWRLGLPLSILVLIVGVPLIALVFPFSG